jgi:MFS family permease
MHTQSNQSTSVKAPSLFAHRAFTLFWASHILTTLAVQAESVTIGWQVYAIARHSRTIGQSAFLVGMVGLVQFVPLSLLTLIAGAAADRHDRRSIVLLSTAMETVCALALAVLALSAIPRLLPLFLIAALFGASRAFLSPAGGALGPMLVPREILPRAISCTSLADQISFMAGPLIGGAFCAISPALAYAGAAALYVMAAVALFFIRLNTRPGRQPGSHLEQIREGLAYVYTNKTVLGAISMDLFAVLFGGVGALLPVFASDIFKVGPDGFGLLRSGPAIGAAAMAFALSRWPLDRRAGRWMFAGVAVYGAATLVFAIARSLPLALAALIILGAADMISVYVRQSLIQLSTPDHLRGRVSAVAGLFIGASAELGEFESGVAARLLGPVGAAVFGGICSLLVTVSWAQMFPSLRNANRLDQIGVYATVSDQNSVVGSTAN